MSQPEIVIIGGGKGTVRHIMALKPQHWKDLRVIVSVSDTGGSTGRIREDLSTSSWGDARRVIAALAPSGTLMARLFEYRFPILDAGVEEIVRVECWDEYAKGLATMAVPETRFCRVFSHLFSARPLDLSHHLLEREFKVRLYGGKLLGSVILAALSKIEGNPVAGLQASATLLGIPPRQYCDLQQRLANSACPMSLVMPSGEVVGNLILAALDEIEDDFDEAIRSAARLLETRGAVYPCSKVPLILRAYLKGGGYLEGQSQVSHNETRKSLIGWVMMLGPSKVPEYDYDTNPDANSYAVRAIDEANTIFIGPGALHASILASVAVPGIARHLAASRGRIVYWLNTAIRWEETRGFGPEDHVKAILGHAQGINIDLVVVNNRFPDVPKDVELLRWDHSKICGIPVLSANLIDETDLGEGSYFLHDSDKIRAILPKILKRSAL